MPNQPTAAAAPFFERYRATHARRSPAEGHVYDVMVAVQMRNRFSQIVTRLISQQKIDGSHYLIDFDSIQPAGTGWSVVFKSLLPTPGADVLAVTAEPDFPVFPKYFSSLLASYTREIDYEPATGVALLKAGREDAFDPIKLFGSAAIIDSLITYSQAHVDDTVHASTKAKAYMQLLGRAYDGAATLYNFVRRTNAIVLELSRWGMKAVESSTTLSARLAGQASAIGGAILGVALIGLTVWQRFDQKNNPVALAAINATIGLQVVQLSYSGAITLLVVLEVPVFEFLGPLALPLAAIALGIPSIAANVAEWGVVRDIVQHKIGALGDGFQDGYLSLRDDGLIVLTDVVVESVDLQNRKLTIDPEGMSIQGSNNPDAIGTVISTTGDDIAMYDAWVSARLFPKGPGDSAFVRDFSIIHPLTLPLSFGPSGPARTPGKVPVNTIVLSATPRTHWRPAFEQGGFPDGDNKYLNALHDYSPGFVYHSGGLVAHSLWGLAPTFRHSVCTVTTGADTNFSFIVPDLDDLPASASVQTALRFDGPADPRPFVGYDFIGHGRSYQIVLSFDAYGPIAIRDDSPSAWQVLIKKITHEWTMEGDSRTFHDLRPGIFSRFQHDQIVVNDQRIRYDGPSRVGSGKLVLVDEMDHDQYIFIVVDFDRRILTPLLACPVPADLIASNTASVMAGFLHYCDTTGARQYMAPLAGLTNISGSHEINYFVDFDTRGSVSTLIAGAMNRPADDQDFTQMNLNAPGLPDGRCHLPFTVESMVLLADTPRLQKFAIGGSRSLATDPDVTHDAAARLTYQGVLSNIIDRAATGRDYLPTIEINSVVVTGADAALVARIKAAFGDVPRLKSLVIPSAERVERDVRRLYPDDRAFPIAVPLDFAAALPTVGFVDAAGIVEIHDPTPARPAAPPEYRWQDDRHCAFIWSGDTVSVMIPTLQDLTEVTLSLPRFIQDLIRAPAGNARKISFAIGIPAQVRTLTIDDSFFGTDLVSFVPEIGALGSTGSLRIVVQAGFNKYFYTADIQGSDYVLSCTPDAPAPRLKIVAVVDPAFPELLENILVQLPALDTETETGQRSGMPEPLAGFKLRAGPLQPATG